MNVCISDNTVNETDEKMLLVILLGIFEAIKSNDLSIREAEKFLFSPYIFNKLESSKCNSKIINIIERGCELENIKSLIPDELAGAIQELEDMTREELEKYSVLDRARWLQIKG